MLFIFLFMSTKQAITLIWYTCIRLTGLQMLWYMYYTHFLHDNNCLLTLSLFWVSCYKRLEGYPVSVFPSLHRLLFEHHSRSFCLVWIPMRRIWSRLTNKLHRSDTCCQDDKLSYLPSAYQYKFCYKSIPLTFDLRKFYCQDQDITWRWVW